MEIVSITRRTSGLKPVKTGPVSEVPERLLYRVDEACELLSLSRSRIFELLRSGDLRSVKQGRSRRVPHAALLEYVVKLEQEAA